METRNITITLDKAREWYNSSDSSLKKVALQAFSEKELKPSFKDIKTFEDACKVLGINTEVFFDDGEYVLKRTPASKALVRLNIIRQALNKGYKMSLTKGDVYYPQIRFVTQNSTYYNSKLKSGIKKVAKFEVDDEEYDLMGGITTYGSNSGLGDFYSYNGVGLSGAYIGFLSCATKEIAEHMSKYFAKEIFEAMYSDFINFKWIEQK